MVKVYKLAFSCYKGKINAIGTFLLSVVSYDQILSLFQPCSAGSLPHCYHSLALLWFCLYSSILNCNHSVSNSGHVDHS